jgi:flagellar export protein FliJ
MSRAARFDYPLQPVLLTRQWQLDALMQDLSAKLGQLQEAEQEVARISTEMAQVNAAAQLEAGQILQPDRLARVNRYLMQLGNLLQNQRQQVQSLQQEHGQLQQQVAEARRALDAAEQHRDEEQAKFTREQLSSQFREQDDGWSNRGARVSYEENHK